jgi:carbamoyl-phosphate synthase large subunit
MVVIEISARVAFQRAASKATGFPIAKTRQLAIGYTLDEIKNDITRETPACFSRPSILRRENARLRPKVSQADATLTTRMKSVGEGWPSDYVRSIAKGTSQSGDQALRLIGRRRRQRRRC